MNKYHTTLTKLCPHRVVTMGKLPCGQHQLEHLVWQHIARATHLGVASDETCRAVYMALAFDWHVAMVLSL